MFEALSAAKREKLSKYWFFHSLQTKQISPRKFIELVSKTFRDDLLRDGITPKDIDYIITNAQALEHPQPVMSRRFFLQRAGGYTAAAGLLGFAKVLSAQPNNPGHTDSSVEAFFNANQDIIPTVEQYAKCMTTLLTSVFTSEQHSQVPSFVDQRIRTIFSGALREIQSWNESLVAEGLRAHYTSYFLQDFRNSSQAMRIHDFYNTLAPKSKPLFEQRIRDVVANERTYYFLLRLGVRPLAIDPKQVPEYRTAEKLIRSSPLLTEFSVYDQQRHLLARGVEESPSRSYEANMYYAFDDDTLIFYAQYYGNTQPNFMYYDEQSFLKKTDGHFFKTYLGRKGQRLWYKIHTLDNIREFALTDEQVKHLKSFFTLDHQRHS